MAGPFPGRSAGTTPELDLAEQKSWQNFLATILRMTAVLNRQLTDRHELSLSDVQLLELLGNSPAGSLQMGALAEALPVLPSRLTRQVRRLENQGLVVRAISPLDRRRVVASITDAGRAVAEAALVTYSDSVRTHFLGQLTRPQIAATADSCGQISAALKRSKRSANSRLR